MMLNECRYAIPFAMCIAIFICVCSASGFVLSSIKRRKFMGTYSITRQGGCATNPYVRTTLGCIILLEM